MDRGAWQATVHGSAKSQTQLSNRAHACAYTHARAHTHTHTHKHTLFIVNEVKPKTLHGIL